MRKININNPEELKKFKMETTGFVSSYGFPYRLDDLTDKGANYTVFCPLRWKSAFPPAKLHKLLREDVDADKITVEYVEFVKEPIEVNNMTDRDKIRTEVKRRITINTQCVGHSFDHTDERIDELEGILSFIDSLQEELVSVWHDSSEMPKEKKLCLIRYSANDGASTNNFEVVIAKPLTRKFVTRSYPHKTGYQHTIHGENTIKVDEYQDRREYIPFSDIDEWAYIDDLLNLSNVQRTAKNWKEPVSEDLKKVYEKYVDHQIERIYPDLSPNLPRQSRMALKVFDGTDIELAFEAGAKWGENQAKVEIQAQSIALAHGCPEESITEDLEEEIGNYVKRNGYDGLDSIEEVKYIARHFANWQKQQMMKDVKEAHVIMSRITQKSVVPILSAVLLDENKYREGDKVKLIIIKED